MKNCRTCNIDKPLDSFSMHPQGIYGRHPRCNSCRGIFAKKYYALNRDKILARQRLGKNYHRDGLKKFGLTPDQYAVMLNSQLGVCDICGAKPTVQRLAVDHDHKTGKIRGLLCRACNLSLGYLRDNVEVLEKAILYLKKHKEDKLAGG
jgi:hypothetical protein